MAFFPWPRTHCHQLLLSCAQTGAALNLYNEIIEPCLKEYEPTIDIYLAQGHALIASQIAVLAGSAGKPTASAAASGPGSASASASSEPPATTSAGEKPSSPKTTRKPAVNVD
mmetsp:Transcript_14971/g.38626  ORF Transcript_14971/g.38626 Transcript_14971/m.38626 type:complete len:113 (-) Transcript_14971:506-844(-)